ncbi:MAG: glycerol-3-phosphate cytidylyltransferase [Candidatus Marinimicrobia bacterium]|nr:glycerol-3-phosphate cytidylyltransferase [Candidatus Neomarinimicrobiota bacterium]MCF7828786.1 glycerol-3-phosphate cytidylyltransferase [Candidatus Neomarinimicrobiota bacterium]MCF7880703.1 glycerol-3-phosphate cytidylyltransferase [Candidatus Neomarinimicrobiota bacterium]
MSRKVITYGTFDLFHFGHLELLRRARELGDYLIVAVSTDKFNKIKEKRCIYKFEHRIKIVEAIRYVDEVIPENRWEQKRDDILSKNVDILVMGDDWEGKFDELNDVCETVYLPRTSKISTTDIVKNIEQNNYR